MVFYCPFKGRIGRRKRAVRSREYMQGRKEANRRVSGSRKEEAVRVEAHRGHVVVR